MKKSLMTAGLAMMLTLSGYVSAVVVECNVSQCNCGGGVCYCPASACRPTGENQQP